MEEANLYVTNTTALQARPVLQRCINFPVILDNQITAALNPIMEILRQIRADLGEVRADLAEVRADQALMQLQIRNSPLIASNMMRNNTDRLSMLYNANNQLPTHPIVSPHTKRDLDSMSNPNVLALLNFYGVAIAGKSPAVRKELLRNHLGAS